MATQDQQSNPIYLLPNWQYFIPKDANLEQIIEKLKNISEFTTENCISFITASHPEIGNILDPAIKLAGWTGITLAISKTIMEGYLENKDPAIILKDSVDIVNNASIQGMAGMAIVDVAMLLRTGEAIISLSPIGVYATLLGLLTSAGIEAYHELNSSGTLFTGYGSNMSGERFANPALNSIMANQSAYLNLTTSKKVGLPDPIAIDMDGDGIETISKDDSSAYFDMDKNGFAEKTGWVKGDDALLVRDINGDGIINDGGELFGDQTVLSTGVKAANGFEALGELDSNQDGKITAEDEQFSTLRVWQDKNGDGVSQADELLTLEQAEIKSISLSTINVNANDGSGNINSRISSVEFENGETHNAGEFLFDTNTIDTESAATYTGTFEIPDEIKLLPFLDGISNIDDLHTAMAKDAVLLTLVQDYINETDAGKLSEDFDKIMYKWFGVDNIAPASRGPNMDARQLVILEKVFQSGFNGWWNQHYRSTNVNTIAAPELKKMYEDIKNQFNSNMILQTHLKEYVLLGAINIKEDGSISVNRDIADFIMDYQKLSGGEMPESANTFEVKFTMLSEVVSACSSEEELTEYVTYYATRGSEYVNALRNLSQSIVLVGSENEDSLAGNSADNKIYGFDGNDKLYGNDGADTLHGGEGDDLLSGGNHNDSLYGGEGNDSLYGGNNNDIIDGGKGDDYLSGGEHSDTYIYRRGDGSDIIEEYNYKPTNGLSTDKVIFSELTESDIEDIYREGNDIVLKFKDTEEVSGDQIRFKNWFLTDRNNDSYRVGDYDRKIEIFEFADGTKWTGAKLESSLNVYGTEGDDVINGQYVAETIYAGEGNNRISAGGGNDTVYSGDGDDIITTTGGNNTIYGGNHNDIITVGAGNDKIYGDAGNDILDGGKGDDYLAGGEHSDTYIYRRGDGSDIIEEYNYKPTNGLSTDKVIFTGLNESDIEDLYREGNDIVLKFKDTEEVSGDQIRFKNWFLTDRNNDNYRVGSYDRKIEIFEFADGTLWTGAQLESNLNVYGTEGDDVISGQYVAETIYGGSGNDKLYGNDGADTLHGGEGDDLLSGGNHNDSLYGGEGNDQLYGGNNNDILDGGKGDDYLAGGEHSDTYIYRRGDGSDVIEEYNYKPTNGLSTDKVIFTGLNESDIEDLYREGNDIVLKFKDTEEVSGDQIRFKNWFLTDRNNDSYRVGSYDRKIEEFTFADGTKWNTVQIEAMLPKYGSDGNDVINGDANSNTLYGGKGDDVIYGKGGNDRIYGGDGDDYLHGGEGSNILDGGDGINTAVFEGNHDDYKVLSSEGKQYVFKQNTSGYEIDTLINIEHLQFADQTKSDDYSNFSTTDTLKYIASYQEMINQYGISDINGDWAQSLNGANKNFVSQGYKNGLGSFDSMGYMTEHKTDIESVFGYGNATEENSLKYYISQKKANG